MYLTPRQYRCQKCGFECQYGEHAPFPAPILSEGPVCPKCYADFLREHCGVMASVEKFPAAPTLEKLPGASVRNFYS